MSTQAKSNKKCARLPGRLVIVGFGSIASAALPVLLQRLDVAPEAVTVLCTPSDDTAVAAENGVRVVREPLTTGNYEAVLQRFVGTGDFLLNLSVGVSSEALVRYCWSRGALYLDTSIEPWSESASDVQRPLSHRSNYALREALLAFRLDKRDGPTALVTQGANPGLISALTKQALLEMAGHHHVDIGRPVSSGDWGRIAQQLGIRAIHVAEQDTQCSAQRKARGEFVNTWSVDALIEEGMQPAELGWGTHERYWPADARRHGFGSDAAIYLTRPGFATRVRSWTPLGGPYHGFLISHGESISITDHLTLRDEGEVVYRPTVHYAYRPCDDALLSIDELAGRGWRAQDRRRILRADIVGGRDELGVLLMGNERGVYWYGSRLSMDDARCLAPHNTATTLQVVAGILGGMVWMLEHPRAGIVEPDDIDHRTILDAALPYLGEMAGTYGSWTPLAHRSPLFDEPLDPDDPWQFLNIRVP
ncbi:saccharopine dehydrogenase C-terminal domain-containing protein [Mycetohabitans endofungorum]|uniref:saccharopine dehydrogenase C-terminal domain-containing protein n=1 Tax=Mycetohabitans endofungorum TaxID=417203 RepID=UPI002B06209F|nr:saccharopine dehydrogenase C-terminal domain-containing protein [Mycetohabitans endofungorum]